jgi:PAS domain S-box-containing protein
VVFVATEVCIFNNQAPHPLNSTKPAFSTISVAYMWQLLSRINRFFARQNKWTIASIAVVVSIVVGVIDFATDTHLTWLVFYIFPACFVGWYTGRRSAVAIAVFGSLLWYVDKSFHPSNPQNVGWVLFWNFLMRLSVFVVCGLLSSEVAARRRAEERQSQTNEALRQQTNILESILNSMGDGVIVADAAGKIILYNPEAERLVRKGLGEVTLQDWLSRQQTYMPDILTAYPSAEHPLLQTIQGKDINGAEMLLSNADGRNGVWLSCTGRPLIDQNKQIRGGVIVMRDVTHRRILEKQIAEISDREQSRIGQDLHDTLCQQLVSVSYATEILRLALEQQTSTETAKVDTIAEMINQSITQARQFARGLYPVRLEADGLSSALEELTNTVQARSKVRCRFTVDEPVFISDEVAAINLFRIAQEAVNNAIKHSRAENISIGLGAVEDEVTLTVNDDGIGFPTKLDRPQGMGLNIMNYRARMIGASLDIRRGARGGTIVICSFRNQNTLDSQHVHATQS